MSHAGFYSDLSSIDNVNEAVSQAEQYKDEAQGFRDEAEGFSSAASASENSASASASAASSSANSASNSANSASTSASTASTAATNASTSATNAATSASNAATSESNAAASAAAAAVSEANVNSAISTYDATLANEAGYLNVTAAGVTPTDKRTLANWFGNLRSSVGSAIVGYIQLGTGAVMRTIQDRLREKVSVLDFMTDAERADTLLTSPTLDHGPAIQKAIDAVTTGVASGIRGRAVCFPGNRNYRIASAVVLRSGTAFIGEFEGLQDNYAANEPVIQSKILVTTAGSITGNIGVTFKGVSILRDGLTIPQTAAQVATWSGVGINLPNNGASIEKCFIGGFATAVQATNHSRLRVKDTLIDCLNGIDNSGSFDVTYLHRTHAWPYLSIGSGDSNDLKRSGTAFSLHDVADWAKVSDCFSYGYLTGFSLNNVNSVTLFNCGADNVAGHVGARGISVTGTCVDTRIIIPQCAAQETGIYTNITAPSANNLTISNANLWTNTNEGIRVDGASNFQIKGGYIRGSTYGISLNNGSLSGQIEGIRFGNTITTDCIRYQTSTDNVRVTNCTLEAGGAGRLETTGKTVPTLASAATITPNAWFDTVQISGTTGITAISGATSAAGRRLVFRFQGALTITNSANIILRGGVNVTTAAGNVIVFEHLGGGVWFESARNF